ncbi:MAG: NAD(P)H-dependent oxidoreductase [Oligoflexia bacterium]|nr:NAD(P)H-dependent oxidoreductase [Oligoflexia bacterium]
MKLLIINGSPKLGKNNTSILLDKFISGFNEKSDKTFQIYRMNTNETYQNAAKIFFEADNVLIAFPLYSYSMPAGVKLFIEALEPYIKKCHGKKVGFLIQYGFEEATHARPLEKYLASICKILECEYMGTIIRGGCDGLCRGQQIGRARKILQGIYEIGRDFGTSGKFDQDQLDHYSAPEIQKKMNPLLAKIIFWAINKFYWERAFKKNGVNLKESFAKPYGQ